MNTILALVDADERAKEILENAFRYAEEHEARLIIHHHLFQDEEITVKSADFTINGDSTISKYAKMFRNAFTVDAEYRFSSGKFKKEVLDCVEKEDVDLIIMGSDGVSDTKERILGSHAEIVLTNAECSVLIIKDRRLNHTLKQVVFASSFNEKDKEVFRFFLQLMKLSKNTTIHLLMVDTYTFFNQPPVLVKESMEEFELLAKPYKTKSHFFHGISIEDGITKFLKEVKPDLLVMSNKYSRMIRSALSGSKMVSTLHHNQYPFLNIDYEKSTIKI